MPQCGTALESHEALFQLVCGRWVHALPMLVSVDQEFEIKETKCPNSSEGKIHSLEKASDNVIL
jgi:hypothetical protein